mmetsp:Transcript_47725/g.91206  ORF Transcript_47725/g.91206 Transcript_47725/m.91206 type:complete len:685 (-) Transcript_47725:583-2637(-)|eukprot:CAMPEP_0114232118 /NCGR_PEP_ID=MMETSP0058-20121206/4428_1 /TAXON_ID=36894 /ORGANISM="Pyramimonas parkeae, CCMP726" /LENGTH=684 /DNA_ID=CAMNT_0001343555 /DNA_START=359 /DNA_END=2413 /DNA_ORIENTATION=+
MQEFRRNEEVELPGVNVVIPIGGAGLRFKQAGFTVPKPMINIAGRPMLLWVLDSLVLTQRDIIWIAVVKKTEKQFGVVRRVRQEFPRLDVRHVELTFKTRGAAETLFSMLRSMTREELARRTLSIDCHTFYRSDIVTQFKELPPGQGCSFYFEDNGHEPIFSYITMDNEHRILDIREKQRISNLANAGAYGFSSGQQAMDFLYMVVDQVLAPETCYLSEIIRRLLLEQAVFVGMRAELLYTVNSPSKLLEFQELIRREPSLCPRRTRFCFGFDRTLVTYPRVHGDYSTVEPIKHMIDLVRELKEANHTIVIYSERKNLRDDWGPSIERMTLKTLLEFQIPFDEIHFGKPKAEVTIGPNAYNSQSPDLRRSIGWPEPLEGEKDSSMVAARQFNQVRVQNDTVIKAGPRSVLEGEIFFYQNMPADVADLFPRLLSAHVGEPCTLTLERVAAITFTHMFVNRCITPFRLTLLMDALRRLHSSQGAAGVEASHDPDYGPIYENYAKKVEARYQQFEEVYKELLSSEDDQIPTIILEFLRDYEHSQRGLFTKVLHGDAVFSNVLLKGDNTVVLLDMRGCLGKKLTLVGDAVYDLAKVYQSLCGYDYFLLDQPVLSDDEEILLELRGCFSQYLELHYPTVSMDDVKMIAASHYFSLIPLHTEASVDRKVLFWQQCKNCVRSSSYTQSALA